MNLFYYWRISNSYESDIVSEVSHQVINAFSRKIDHAGVHVTLGCSIGVTLYPGHDIDDPVDIIRNADSALYKAKAMGKNTYFVFNEAMLKQISYEKKVKNKLLDVVFDEAFEVYYQPLMDIHANKIVGVEALVRWHDDTLGWIAPDLFVSLAEKSGKIFEIDLWVFKTAIKQVKQWRHDYNSDLFVSINFSPTNFYHANFSDWVDNESIFSDMADWVELEVTERLMLNNDPVVFEGINRLIGKGIKFSVDDFGVGYSSLGYVKNFASVLSKIKIDRIFINEMLTEQFNNAFVSSIMMLSDSLNLAVLAEGVETESQVALLQEIGCRYAQGYYFHKPMPAAEVEKVLLAN